MIYTRFGNVRDIENVVEQIGEQIGSFFDQVRKETPFTTPAKVKEFSPAVDMEEDATHVYIYAELPGLEKSDVKVTLSEDFVLTIKGDKKSGERADGVKRTQSERSFGAFVRTVAVSDQVNTQHIAAELTNGVLKVTIAKSTPEEKDIVVNIQ